MEILPISQVKVGNLFQAWKQKQAALFHFQASFKNKNKYIIYLRLQMLFDKKKKKTN